MKVLRLSPSPGLALLLLLVTALQLGGCAVSPRLDSGDKARVASKTFVITGASSGFGRGVALRLAALQGNVVLAARRTEVLEQLAAQIHEAGGSALVMTTDVSSPDEVQALAQAAIERFGKIDVWVNNAAVGALGRFEDVPVEDHARVIDVNLKGVIYGSHAAMRQFRTQGFGTLVNVGSVESEIPLAYHASYAATKGGVMNLGAAIAEEIRLSGSETINVATVMPWAADTPFWKHAANYTGGTPRMATMDGPEQVVDAIAWVSVNPRKRLPVGWKARGAVISHSLFPSLTERIAANIAHHWQIEKAPPAPPTTGSLYEPMQSGTTVEGDVRERMEREEAARKQSK
ncbi:SDR family NAD(P)-dependent oxidoreductase [Pseudomonas sp. PS1]|jgi:short-subunit dehydrogenase|uniref:SDR family NAD(P)-dependent oxidoreductase n=1 Tax=Stutzerimonas marianensis TaxID=2929513 RepID=A0A9X1W6G8_9GAMM|nr:SDR family NAD(P)-dependent oxidoreductase [Pseudomonas marianensis]MCJ0975991.1 SDR family NAD(P)-dependent oxidoreductase [Pseudomonas marianensis]